MNLVLKWHVAGATHQPLTSSHLHTQDLTINNELTAVFKVLVLVFFIILINLFVTIKKRGKKLMQVTSPLPLMTCQ